MNKDEVLENINKILLNIFEIENPFTIEEILEKFAFDVKLPKEVIDSVTKEKTWTEMENSTNFIKQVNMEKYDEYKGWMITKRDIKSVKDIIQIWNKINYITTERIYNSENVSESDTIYDSNNIYRSVDLRKCKNAIFSDGCGDCESIIACQRTGYSTNCIRVDDSGTCSNSYNVICSAKIVNSYFIHDCKNLYECMFCSHIANKRYCIANMQFEKEEYLKIKKQIVKWILKKSN